MTTTQSQSSKVVVYAALAGNLAVAVVKFIAAALTGSSAMLSEGVHSLVDTGNELLLLYGMKRAAQPPVPLAENVSAEGKVADIYDGEIEATAEALTSLIEPLLITFLGAVIGGMIVALYLPIFSIATAMQ